MDLWETVKVLQELTNTQSRKSYFRTKRKFCGIFTHPCSTYTLTQCGPGLEEVASQFLILSLKSEGGQQTLCAIVQPICELPETISLISLSWGDVAGLVMKIAQGLPTHKCLFLVEIYNRPSQAPRRSWGEAL